MSSLLCEGHSASWSHAHAPARLLQVQIPSSRPSLDKQTGSKIQASNLTIAEPNDELYSLDSRILKREITPGKSHISSIVRPLND